MTGTGMLRECGSTANGEAKRRDHSQCNAFHENLLGDVTLDLTHKAKFG